MEDAAPGPRYAIYYAPAMDSALWRFGARALGYDAYASLDLEQPRFAGIPAEQLLALTETPRRYGFHATLKAPFELAPGYDPASLAEACRRLAAAHRAVPLEGLEVSAIGSFLALVPRASSDALQTFADHVVEAFEPFRAPLSREDVERRLAADLNTRQRTYLETWGYPYVFEEFRFHMTLTGSLPEGASEPLRAALTAAYRRQAVDEPVAVDAIALFRQDARDARFVIERRFPLACH